MYYIYEKIVIQIWLAEEMGSIMDLVIWLMQYDKRWESSDEAYCKL